MKEKGVPLLRSIRTSLVMLTCAEELKRIPYHFYLTACVCSEFEVLAYASRCFLCSPFFPRLVLQEMQRDYYKIFSKALSTHWLMYFARVLRSAIGFYKTVKILSSN